MISERSNRIYGVNLSCQKKKINEFCHYFKAKLHPFDFSCVRHKLQSQYFIFIPVDAYSALEQDTDSIVSNILSNMMKKEVVHDNFMQDLGLEGQKTKFTKDPRTKMQLRHQQVSIKYLLFELLINIYTLNQNVLSLVSRVYG